jgi:ribosome-associated protein
MNETPLVKLVVKAIEDIKGLELKVLDVRDLTTICDYMIMVTGTSNRHVKSIADNVIAQAKAAGTRPMGTEGLEAGEWVLVDLGDVVVHAMQAQARAFYQLEKLWDVPPPEPETVAKPPKPPKVQKERRSRGGKLAARKRTSGSRAPAKAKGKRKPGGNRAPGGGRKKR